MQVTIDRIKWQRGEEGGRLLNPCNGKMCAMGFIALAHGLSEDSIRDRGALPVEAYGIEGLRGYVGESDLEDQIEMTNDNEYVPDDEREEKIERIARKAGDEITFIN